MKKLFKSTTCHNCFLDISYLYGSLVKETQMVLLTNIYIYFFTHKYTKKTYVLTYVKIKPPKTWETI